MFGDVFTGKSIWLSGHTGFKGSWLAAWLLELGARVHGYALEPLTSPSLFEQLDLAKDLAHAISDIRDAAAVERSIQSAQPDYVFHLAAQPLVRQSYQEPRETYETNVMGTINVLEALRRLEAPCVAVMVTTDKCYRNREWLSAYREEDALGGHDPYSSSKAAAEIAIASYRSSFFSADKSPRIRVASARAGNVIGGGDWATDRIVPDSIRALQHGEPVPVRNKTATRPWQHVLEPLSGYLQLASALSDPARASDLCTAFNFGPALDSNRDVAALVAEILKHWSGEWRDQSDPHAPHEAGRLNLAIERAFHLLHWSPVWNFAQTVTKTVDWYRAAEPGNVDSRNMRPFTREQIQHYESDAREKGIAWAQS